MQKLLHLQHHRHTGRLLHHEHTSYRALAVVLAISGLFMVSLGAVNHAAADEFGVSAMVAVPVPTSPPIISSPSNNMTEKANSLLVSGSCPLITPQVVIAISVDGDQVGTGACDSNNDFSVPISMASGVHRITAGVITISGQPGPISNPVTVTSLAGNTPSSIAIVANQPFVSVSSKAVTWTGIINTAGQGNDHVHLDWGDGDTSDYTVQPGEESFTHHYATLASHDILLDVASNGSDTFEQFGAATFTSYTAPVPAATTHSPFFGDSTIVGLYGLYLTTLSVICIIWLEAKHAARQHSIA